MHTNYELVSEHVHVRGQVFLHAHVSFCFWGGGGGGGQEVGMVVHVMLIYTVMWCESDSEQQ